MKVSYNLNSELGCKAAIADYLARKPSGAGRANSINSEIPFVKTWHILEQLEIF